MNQKYLELLLDIFSTEIKLNYSDNNNQIANDDSINLTSALMNVDNYNNNNNTYNQLESNKMPYFEKSNEYNFINSLIKLISTKIKTKEKEKEKADI